MKHIRKILSTVAVLAIMLMINFGNLSDASADIFFTLNFDPNLFNLTTPQLFTEPVTMNTTSVLQASKLTFNAAFSGGALGSISSIISTSSATFSDISLQGPLGVEGDMDFNPGSLVSLGYVTPTPHPPRDEMLTAIGIDQVTGASLVALGYVTPTPHPPRDEMIGWDGWAPNPIIVNGTLNLTGVTINVDSLVDGYNTPYFGDFITLFGATEGIEGTPNLSGSLANRFEYFDPTESGNETGGVRYVGVPEPSTMLLVGSGLLGLVGFGVRRRKKGETK